jgi:fructose transport system permease protein
MPANPATSAPEEPSTAAEAFAARRRSPIQRVQHLLHSYPAISPLLVLIVAWLVFSQLNPRFASAGSLSLVLQQAAVIAALAVGQTLIILTAGIDLSVGAIAILSMLVGAKVSVENGVPGPLAILISLGVGLLAGLLNGLLVTRLKLPPFIVTLGTLSVFTALGILYTKGQSIRASDMPDIMSWTGNVIRIGDFVITYGVVMAVSRSTGSSSASTPSPA